MKINITIEAPNWTDENADFFFDFLMEELWTNNASTGDDARMVSFTVNDGENLVKAYEGEDYSG